jgi:hypothetical protein
MPEIDYMMAQMMECCPQQAEPTHWTNAGGYSVPICGMSRPHLLNTLRFLERKHKPDHSGSMFWALRREAERRGLRPTTEEWLEARTRADAAGEDPRAGYWTVWAGHGFFSCDGNPIRENDTVEAKYRRVYPDQRETPVSDLHFCYQGDSDDALPWPIDDPCGQ